jgi:CheY-like chemotaxis protein
MTNRPEDLDRLKRLSVLAVDDDPLVRLGMVAMIEDLGHDVAEAGSAAEALALLATPHPIDVVITDHSMPGMTGTALIAEIGRLYPSIMTVLATGYGDATPDGVIAADIVRLRKPFTEDDVAAVLAARR